MSARCMIGTWRPWETCGRHTYRHESIGDVRFATDARSACEATRGGSLQGHSRGCGARAHKTRHWSHLMRLLERGRRRRRETMARSHAPRRAQKVRVVKLNRDVELKEHSTAMAVSTWHSSTGPQSLADERLSSAARVFFAASQPPPPAGRLRFWLRRRPHRQPGQPRTREATEISPLAICTAIALQYRKNGVITSPPPRRRRGPRR